MKMQLSTNLEELEKLFTFRINNYEDELQKHVTVTLAAAVPKLGLFISLFGALCLSALGMCFPSIMEACLRYAEKASMARSLVFFKDAVLFTLGLVALVTGTYSALIAVVKSFSPSN